MAQAGDNETLDPDALEDRPEAAARYGPDDEELGRGGLGRVVRVHDRHLDRRVARKELLVSGAALGPRARARFEREARITARLEHPNILPVYEFGVDDAGAPWFTTRAIRGPTLARALDDAPTLDARLRLLPSVVAAGQALAYAHAERVVHRDVTPRNIMVGPFGETVLIDWGLAKMLDQPDDGADGAAGPSPGPSSPALTAVGTAHGTIAYASPEQLAGDLARIDARTDIWGLGATLFQVLTGRPPRAGDGATIPSVRELTPAAPAELASIVARALAPDPGDRYGTMSALVDDLVAWQAGRRVSAHRYGPLEHVQRVLRARPREALIVGVGVVVLAVAAIGAGAVWVAKDGREREARASRATAGALIAAAEGRHRRTLEEAVEALGVHETPEVRGAVLAAGRRWLPRVVARWPLPDCTVPVPGRDGRTVACLSGPEVRVVGGGRAARWTLPSDAEVALWSRAGDALAVGLRDGSILTLRRDEPAPRPVGRVTASIPYSLAWGDDGALRVGTVDGSVERVADGAAEVVVPVRRGRVVQSVEATGPWLVLGTGEGVEAWRTDTATLAWSRPGPGLSLVLAVPERDLVVATAPPTDGSPFVYTLSLSTGALLATAELPVGGQGRPVVTPDGATVLLPAPGAVVALALPGLELRTRVDLDTTDRPRLALGLDGLLVAPPDGVAEAWTLPEVWPARVTKVGPGLVWTAAVSPAGARIATPTLDGVVRAWSWPSLEPAGRWTVDAVGLEETVWLDAGRVLTSGAHGRTFVLDAHTGAATEGPRLFDGNAYGIARFGADRVVAGGEAGSLGVWGLTDGAPVWTRAMTSVVLGLTPVLDGSRAVVATLDGRMWRVRLTDGADEEVVESGEARGSGRPAPSPDRASAVLGARTGQRFVVSRRAAAELGRVAWTTRLDAQPSALAWSPDGAWIAAAQLDGDVIVLDAEDGAIRARLQAHGGQAWGVSFLDGGGALASTGSDGTLRVWDLSDLTTPLAALVAARAPPAVSEP